MDLGDRGPVINRGTSISRSVSNTGSSPPISTIHVVPTSPATDTAFTARWIRESTDSPAKVESSSRMEICCWRNQTPNLEPSCPRPSSIRAERPISSTPVGSARTTSGTGIARAAGRPMIEIFLVHGKSPKQADQGSRRAIRARQTIRDIDSDRGTVSSGLGDLAPPTGGASVCIQHTADRQIRSIPCPRTSPTRVCSRESDLQVGQGENSPEPLDVTSEATER